ncbi:suppressor of loss of ypt1 [Phlyctochytrium bullatum]|nr:suppressor of loss of ypt1 [Phlyctochytrium bullatum]
MAVSEDSRDDGGNGSFHLLKSSDHAPPANGNTTTLLHNNANRASNTSGIGIATHPNLLMRKDSFSATEPFLPPPQHANHGAPPANNGLGGMISSFLGGSRSQHHHHHHHYSHYIPTATSPTSATRQAGASGNFGQVSANANANAAAAQANAAALAASGETKGWVKFVVLCFLWYLSSAVTNNVGKQLLGLFNYPVTLTYFQFGIVAVLAFLSSKSSSGFGRIRKPTYDIFLTTAPLSVFQILGHVFSTMAISRVSVSFAHTIKALSPLFTVFVYRIFFRILYTSKVYVSLFPLTIGVMLVCSNKVTFQLIGFVFSLLSTIVFVAQNIFSKKLFIQSSSRHTGSGQNPSAPKKLDKLNLLFYSALIAFVLMFPLWFYADGVRFLFGEDDDTMADGKPHLSSHPNRHPASANVDPSDPAVRFQILILFAVNGMTHFAQAVFAFWILSLVSPVTYSIASLVKRIFVILASIVYFGENVSGVQAFGIALTFAGLWMYDRAKADIAHGEAQLVELTEKSEGKGGLPMSLAPKRPGGVAAEKSFN